MNPTDTAEPWIHLTQLIKSEDQNEIFRFLEQLPVTEIPITLSRLEEDDQGRLLSLLPAETSADLMEHLSEAQALSLLESLEPVQAAAILDELPSDEQADLIHELDDQNAAEILGLMSPAEAEIAKSFSRYEDDVAGGLMIAEFLQFKESTTVAEVLSDLRNHADQYRDYQVQYAYVTDDQRRLTGVLRLRDLLLAPHDVPVEDIMLRHPVSVADTMELEDIADLFDHHHYLGVPVVDAHGILLGVVQKSAVDDAWTDRQDSDLLKMQGIVGGEELRSMPTTLRARRRLTWLSLNIVLNVIAASVIAVFQETLSSVIALAVFLPIISDMSGCSGNQAVAVSMRELSLGLIRAEEFWRVWKLEVSVGLINGTALGLLIGIVAWLWKGNPYLGLVVGVALCINTLVAVSLGGLVPLALKRLRLDPAVASGPILTTVTDMCGFFLVLGIATLMLSRLT